MAAPVISEPPNDATPISPQPANLQASQWRTQVARLLESGTLPTLVAITDDPASTHSCPGMPLLTSWSIADMVAEVQTVGPKALSHGFFVLTDLHALRSHTADSLIRGICYNLRDVAFGTGKRFQLLLGCESISQRLVHQEHKAVEDMLRTHDFVIYASLGTQNRQYLFEDEGGVTQDVSAGVRPVKRIGSSSLQARGPACVTSTLLMSSPGTTVMVDAATDQETDMAALGILQASLLGKTSLFRANTKFFAARCGVSIDPSVGQHPPIDFTVGGLIIAGFHTDMVTAQVDFLRSMDTKLLISITLDVDKFVDPSTRAEERRRVQDKTSYFLSHCVPVLVETSRDHAFSEGTISDALAVFIKDLTITPSYIIAIGCRTAWDLAKRTLGLKKALTWGEVEAGIPVWRFTHTSSSKWDNLVYVPFPDNVGNEQTLAYLVVKWIAPRTDPPSNS